MKNKYILDDALKKLNNYQLLILATETFTQFIYFLEQERNYKELNIKIGEFEYDDWKAKLYCILNEEGVFFKHIRNFDKKEWKSKTLTEQLIYAWGFEEINFEIDFNIINNYYEILNNKDKEIFEDLYDIAHCKFW